MKDSTEIIESCGIASAAVRFGLVLPAFLLSLRSTKTPSLRHQQTASEQIQVRQSEGGIQPGRILRQSAVANLAEPPKALDHVENMFDSGPSRGSSTVDESWYSLK